MASPNTVFTELVTTTLREHPAEIADNVTNHNALYNRLKKRGQIEVLDGGYEIVEPLAYAENSTIQRFSMYDTLNIQASDVLSAAKYDWVNTAVHVTAAGEELRKNSGGNQIMNLAKQRIKVAKMTAANTMNVDLHSSGALTNQMGGIAHIIQSDGQGTVGGISAATYTFWRNQFREATGTNAVTKSNIKSEMNPLWLSCVRGMDKPDLILATHDWYSLYEESLQDLQRYASSDMASAGFESLKYKSADMVFDDDDTNFATNGQKMYFINTTYLSLKQHRDAQWTVQDDKMSVNQDAVVIPMYWMGQLCCSNRARQGILLDAS